MSADINTSESAAQIEALKKLFAQRIGLRIPRDAHDRFVGMLYERAAHLSCATLDDYRHFLADHGAVVECEEFARAFTSSETFFFRDHGQFDLLRSRLLPELIARHRGDKTLRLWSAGCSGGEEAYSLAMLVDMLLPEHDSWNVLILGTDIDTGALAKARHGHYGQWSFRMVPAGLMQRYFRLAGKEWELDERIRSMVTFRKFNLVSEAFPDFGSELHDMDLILCRNVFIYFDSAAVSSVAEKMAATLTEGGYLMTAHTELIGQRIAELKSRLFAEGVVYQRHLHLPATVTLPPLPVLPFLPAEPPVRIVPPREVHVSPGAAVLERKMQAPQPSPNPAVALAASARGYADRGEYELAEQMCRQALAADPLAAAPYFLLAQLAQLKGDFELAKECLNKTIYLDHRCVAAHLELAALYERTGDMPQAEAMRRAALGIVRTMPRDEVVDQYEMTAGELTQWLV